MAVPAFSSGSLYASAGSTLLSGLLNYGAAQNQNDIAKRQFAENLRFQRYQYEDSKRYNSYENQVAMMKRAGLNPSLMFGSGASPVGNSQVGGVSPTSSVTSPDYSFIPSSLSNLAQVFSQASLNKSVEDVNTSQVEKNAAETRGLNIDNLYKDEYWKSSNYLRNAQAWLFDKEADLTKLSFQYDLQSMGDRLFEQRWKSEEQRASVEARLITNAFLPEQLREGINQIITSQKVALQQGVASLKSAEAAIMSAVNQRHAFDAQYGGSPKQRRAFYNATMRSLEQSLNESKSREWSNIRSKNPLPINLADFKKFDDWKLGKLKTPLF